MQQNVSKTLTKYSFILVIILVVTIVSVQANFAFAQSTTVSIPKGTSTPGCETTSSCFTPSSIKVSTGSKVTWKNDDITSHTATSVDASAVPSGVFDSSILMPGKTFSFTFKNAGSYSYICVLHPWMKGAVKVTGTTTSSDSSKPATPKDSDKDGIPDEKDKCPKEAETKNGYQDDDGCPDKKPAGTTPSTSQKPTTGKDSDKDGIPDEKDKCPNAAETKNGYKDDDGCPDKKP